MSNNLTVWSDKFVPSWPPKKPAPGKEPKIPLAGGVGSIADVLQFEYQTDAHYAAYDSTEFGCYRLSKDAPRVVMTTLVLDLDGPDHKADAPWRAETLTKLGELWAKHPNFAYYETRGGYRVLFGLAAPVVINGRTDAKAWALEYLRTTAYLQSTFDLAFDDACSDPWRLYRAPFVLRDGARQAGYLSPLPEAWGVLAVPAEFVAPNAKPLEAAQPIELARAHLAKMPPSLSGANGHGALFNATLAAVRGFELKDDDAFEVLSEFNERCEPPWDDSDLLHKIESIRNTAGQEGPPPGYLLAPGGFRCTDQGNADRLIAKHGKRLRYNFARGLWLIYEEETGRWKWDQNGGIQALARVVLKGIYLDAKAATDAATEKALDAWAKASGSAGSLEAAIKLARSADGVPVQMSQLDADPYMLNCANGVVNLKTGRLLPHNPGHLITRTTGLDYNAAARSSLFEGVYPQALGSDVELMTYLQRVMGYSLLGLANERAFFFLYGPPGTMKSTLVDAWSSALGEYAMTADFDTWVERPGNAVGQNRGDVVRLAGARLVTSVEMTPGRRLDTQLLKKVTGGDEITAAGKYEREVSFRATFTLVMAANDAPRVRDDDGGMWQRLKRIPLNAAVPVERQDKSVKDRLMSKEHATAVLAFMVRGCLDYQQHGLGKSQAIELSTAEYRSEMDVFATFLEDTIEFGNFGHTFVSRKQIRELWSAWSRDNRTNYTISDKDIVQRLEVRGAREHKAVGVRGYQGLRLIGAGASTSLPPDMTN